MVRETESEIIEGTLICGHPTCGSVYPIIDGIPILVADLATYLNQHAHEILWRNNLDHTLQSCIGDALGSGVVFDTNRHYLSAYVDGHYRDRDTQNSPEATSAPVLRFLESARETQCTTVAGPRIDLGASVGRATFELAALTPGELTLGIDLNFTMLRFARGLQENGSRPFPLKRVGVVYDQHHIEFPQASELTNVDFWACDAIALPFEDNTFGLALSLNVLDCVPSPTTHLSEILRLLSLDGAALLATPFDWSAPVTPMNAWLGGHSQHNEWHGESTEILHETLALLEDANHARLVVESTQDIPWEVRIHERHRASYQSLLMHLRKSLNAEPIPSRAP